MKYEKKEEMAQECPFQAKTMAFNGLKVEAEVASYSEVIAVLTFETPVIVEELLGLRARISRPVEGWVDVKQIKKI